MSLKIEKRFRQKLPSSYLHFLLENPDGDEKDFDEYAEEEEREDEEEFEGRPWMLMGEQELLTSWEMKGVGQAANFECLKLYIHLFREFSSQDVVDSNVGEIELDRIAKGFVIGEENGDYLYLDASDGYSVWIYYHDGGDVRRVADSFEAFMQS